MEVIETRIPGAFVIEPEVLADARGLFAEIYQRRRYAESGIDAEFVQDNRSYSQPRVLRGLHYQIAHPQGHLVTVLRGTIFDVGLDLRRDSPAFGRWHSVTLASEPLRQAYWPPGVAHGFCVIGDGAEVHYKCAGYYVSGDEGGVRWNDPDLAIPWPVAEPIVAPRDAEFPCLKDIEPERLPKASLRA